MAGRKRKQNIKREYSELRKDHESRQQEKHYITLADARKNRVPIDWSKASITKPTFLGTKVFVEYPLEEIRKYIDWTPFFQTWMLYGRYPGIFITES